MTPLEFAAKRHALGIRQADAAQQLGVNRRTITRWETTHSPSVAAIVWIGNKYEALLDYVDQVLVNNGAIDMDNTELQALTPQEITAYIATAMAACHGAKIVPRFTQAS